MVQGILVQKAFNGRHVVGGRSGTLEQQNRRITGRNRWRISRRKGLPGFRTPARSEETTNTEENL